MEAMTDEELESVQCLKTALQENDKFNHERHSDFTLLRFLRARSGDFSDALEMLIKHEEWRVAEKVEELLDSFEFPEFDAVMNYFPRFLHHQDRQGRPIYINNWSEYDLDKAYELANVEKLAKDVIFQMEVLTRYILPAASSKAGKPVYQLTMIVDLAGSSIYQFNNYRPFLVAMQAILVPNYPEILHKLYMINAPFIFTSIWYVAQTLLDPKTLEKVSILGEDYMSELEKELDTDMLPVSMQGECECVEWGGCSKLRKGCWNDGSAPGFPKPEWESRIERKLLKK